MLDLLLTAPFLPFTLAIGLLFGLLTLEIVFALMGGSFMTSGAESDLPGADAGGFEAELDTGFDAETEIAPEADLETGAAPTSLLGLAEVPSMIWLSALLMGFGIGGMGVQLGLSALTGAALPAWAAVPVALVPGLWFARGFSRVFARLLPKTETAALSERSLGRRRGIVSQGTAARGRPAEVRVTDGYGNTHYLRAEPMSDTDTIPQGTEVLVIRDRRRGTYHLVPVSD